ncbi:MAG: hypothetical protein AUI36_20100 [Cyanobacteria bacterium 13_1_40CM_2_61_4]|nr:MAG: hypothetical protein AUI36_20100 [Cyanobacteria bacterium 13_1_40CM_2_61_4]
MSLVLRKAGEFFHRVVASSRFGSGIYLGMMHHVSRRLSQKGQQRLRNSINSVRWPEISLPSRVVTLGERTDVRLHPHFHEFDLEAALSRRLHYEQEVFAFLETRMANYQSVIEIGANVGVFTLFFARWLTRRKRPGSVFAFEPSRCVYQRLLQNLEVNHTTNVVVINCAVGRDMGFFPFFEPEDHLTNGSLDAAFAEQFASNVKALPVLVINGHLIETLPGLEDPVLLKMDCEGTEARVLSSLEGFIRSHRPEIVIEVLPRYATDLNALTFLKTAGYQFFNITPAGLVAQERLIAGDHRDYFLSATTPSGASN